MPINYCLIARGSVVLTEASLDNHSGGITQVVRKVLLSIQNKSESKFTYLYDGWIFNFYYIDKYYFFCMTDQQFGRTSAFAFLEDLSNSFLYKLKKEDSLSYDDVPEQLKNKMREFNDRDIGGNKNSKINEIKNQLGSVKEQMRNNLDSAVSRGEALNSLETKSSELSSAAVTFRNQAKVVYQQACCAHWKCYGLIFLILVVVAVLLAMSFCGVNFKKCSA